MTPRLGLFSPFHTRCTVEADPGIMKGGGLLRHTESVPLMQHDKIASTWSPNLNKTRLLHAHTTDGVKIYYTAPE